MTDIPKFQKKMWSYLTLHFLTVHKWLGQINDEWKAEKYYQAGFDSANYCHNLLASSSMSITVD